MTDSCFLRALAALVPVAVLCVAVWAWLGRPVSLPDVPGSRLECLSYTPAHDGGSPLDKDFTAPVAMIAADMARVKPLSGCIRTYSALRSEGDVVAAAAKAGIQVWLGIWISADDEANTKEIDRAVAITNAYPRTVRLLVVGNEVLLRREMTAEKLARIIRGVRERTGHPVTYADIYEFWRRNRGLAEAVDVVTVHVLPYWDDPTPVSIDEVQGHARRIIETTRATFPGKAIQIGEIGWPSAGRTRGAAVPSRINEARFIREFAVQAGSIGLPYNIIEAVDQPWKRRPEGTVGGYWGVLDKHREAKFALIGPVSEWPRWRWAAAASVAGAVLALAAALAARRDLSWGRWLATAGAGALCVAVLWGFADQAQHFAIGIPGALWAGYLMLIAAFGGVLLTLRAGGWPPLPEAPLAAYRWLVLAPAMVAALALAVDGRHRDFLTLAFLLPALALILFDREPRAPVIAEGWVAAGLALCGLFAIDSIGNREAILWALCCLALVWPLRRQVAAELGRLGRAMREDEEGGDDRHG